MHAIPAAMQPFPFATMHEKGRAKIQKRVSLMQKSFDLNNAGLGSVRAGGHWANVTPGDITPALDKRPRGEYDIVPAPPPILADAEE